MVLLSNVLKARFRMFRWYPWFSLVLVVALLATGCAKGPAGDQPTVKNAGNANQQAVPLYLQPTLKGDIDRISLAISMARDSAKLSKWQEAASQLRGAKKEIDTALSRKPHLSEEFGALKSAIDRAIPAVENGENEADARLIELQASIGAIKVNTF